ncbi:MAG: glycosyltransferase, partial [Thermodesulfobacteriota bacterium]
GALVFATGALSSHLERLGEQLDEVSRAGSRAVERVEDLGVEAASLRVLSERTRGLAEQVLGKLQLKRRLLQGASTLLGRAGPATHELPGRPPPAANGGAQARAELDAILARHADRVGTVLFAPTLRWSHELFQRPHQLARELARQGYLVFYCESLWPEPGTPPFAALGERLYAARAPLAAYAEIASPIVFFLSYNAFELSPLRDARAVYELIDELHVFRGDPEEIRRNHEHLLDTADVVVATARNLHRRIADRRPDAILCPNAADYEHFRRARDATVPVPAELAAVLRPGRRVVGYYGALATWLDYELVRYAALERPDLEFVLIGPDYDGSLAATDVLSLDNVHRLDGQPYAALPSCLRAFDVATIPFVVNDITESTSPIKLFEYMAGGKPVVTTAMQECLRYPGVLVARDGAEYVAQIDRALTLVGDPHHLAVIDGVARDNTWAARVAQIRAALAKGTMRHAAAPPATASAVEAR